MPIPFPLPTITTGSSLTVTMLLQTSLLRFADSTSPKQCKEKSEEWAGKEARTGGCEVHGARRAVQPTDHWPEASDTRPAAGGTVAETRGGNIFFRRQKASMTA